MKLPAAIAFYLCTALFVLALAITWPQKQPKCSYTIQQFCADHPDICTRGRMAVYQTPSPIPQR